MKISFLKYHGAGNDFVLVDNRDSASALEGHVAFLCNRRLGVGADGVLIVESSKIADCKMRIFNADGREAAMCGNGLRCVVDFLSGFLGKKPVTIEVSGRVFLCRWIENQIAVNLGAPRIAHWPIQLALPSGKRAVYVMDTGVMHAVLFVEDILNVSLEDWGKEIRWHAAFMPNGVNVNCVQVGDGSVFVRTFERGVEGETLACGTGVAAAALAASRLYGLKERISVKTRTSLQTTTFCNTMTVALSCSDVELIGPATYVFSGEI